MTRRSFATTLFCVLLGSAPVAPQTPPSASTPVEQAAGSRAAAPRRQLILGIVIDQFRYDYLTRFRNAYSAGLDRMLRRGAVFTNARYMHFPTVTAVGHSTFLTGATPEMSGIVNNEWYDRQAGKDVTSVSDDGTRLLGGGGGPGASPRRLLVSTVGDELKIAYAGKPRVIGVSLKDRSAILPAGHMANGAYWFDPKSGNFVSSTFYFAELPGWARDFNQGRRADKYAGIEWKSIENGKAFKKMAASPDPAFYASLEATPFGNELIEAFAERAIEAEQLGRHQTPDLLTVSFSSNDYVGHQVGPDAPEVRDISIRTDRLIGKLLQFIDARIGLANVLVVLTADHGVAPVPEVSQARKMPGGRLAGKAVLEEIRTKLAARYGPGNWILSAAGGSPYLNHDLAREKNVDEAEVERVASDAAAAVPHVFRVYRRSQLLEGRVPDDPVSRLVVNGFNPARAADLFILLEPYWITSASGTTHGNVFGYDTHVPVVFMGPGIRPGRYDGNIAPNDIAPTLATLLSVETPSGSVGRVLSEALLKAPPVLP